ncbi:MAG: hypothetical protein N2257_09100 [Thermodesulfovibrionales bacterium]|nr:hypothetical protein [Thermodesulfovibrionales bacterium]
MKYEGLKIYGMCLERLQHQIKLAKERVKTMNPVPEKVVLECYFTKDVEDIIDILELYDIEHKDMDTVKKKLEDLADDLSIMMRERVEFSFNEDGDLCLYLFLKK